MTETDTRGASDAEQAPALPGYILLRRIGAGALGDVWLAQDEREEYVAIKLVDRERLRLLSRPNREERAIELLRTRLPEHDRLICVYDIGESDRYLYYVMDLADNANSDGADTPINPATYRPKTLAEVVLGGQLMAVAEALGIVRELLGAVKCLHEHGIVHRDIKPSNIVCVDGCWILADIGRMAEETTHITTVGSPEFMAPTGRIDHTADLYALGKVLYCLVTGNPPRAFPTIPLARLTDQRQVATMSQVHEVIIRACAPHPQDRFASAEEFDAALETCLEQLNQDDPRAWQDVSIAPLHATMSQLAGDTMPGLGYRVPRTPGQPRRTLPLLLRYPWTALLTFAAVSAALGGTWIFGFPIYNATGYLVVQPPAKGQLVDSPLVGPIQEYERLRNNHALAIQDPSILMRVLNRPEVRETKFFKWYGNNFDKALGDFQKLLDVAPIRDSDTIRVSIAVREPSDPRLIVNTILDEYASCARSSGTDLAQQELDTMRNAVERSRADLRAITAQGKELRQSHNGAVCDAAIASSFELLRGLRERQSELQVERACIEATIRAGAGTPLGTATGVRTVLNDLMGIDPRSPAGDFGMPGGSQEMDPTPARRTSSSKRTRSRG